MLPLGFRKRVLILTLQKLEPFRSTHNCTQTIVTKYLTLNLPHLKTIFFKKISLVSFWIANCEIIHPTMISKRLSEHFWSLATYIVSSGDLRSFVRKNRGLSSTLLLFAHVLHVWHVDLSRQMEGSDTSAGKMHVWHVNLKSLNASMWYHRWKDGWGHKMSPQGRCHHPWGGGSIVSKMRLQRFHVSFCAKTYSNSTVAMLTPPPISTTHKNKNKIQRVDKV
jgi:hypothetical protein